MNLSSVVTLPVIPAPVWRGYMPGMVGSAVLLPSETPTIMSRKAALAGCAGVLWLSSWQKLALSLMKMNPKFDELPIVLAENAIVGWKVIPLNVPLTTAGNGIRSTIVMSGGPPDRSYTV